jgi:hypothetical protein
MPDLKICKEPGVFGFNGKCLGSDDFVDFVTKADEPEYLDENPFF